MMASTITIGRSIFLSAVLVTAFLLVLDGCHHEENALEREERLKSEKQAEQQRHELDSLHKLDSLDHVRRDKALHRFDTIRYDKLYIKTGHILDSLRRLFRFNSSADTAKILAAMNRKELRFIGVGDTVVVPRGIHKDLRAYSCFPQFYDSAARIPKIILISNVYQCYACYEYGDLVRFAACNTGAKGKPTFPGRYAVVWKQEKRVSSLNDEWILPFTVNFHQYAGNAFHQFEMPGRPVSHSCVRQYLDDAKWLFKWVRTAKLDSHKHFIPWTGTPVLILGMFDYTRRRGGPWWDVQSNYDRTISLPNDPMHVEEALIPMSQVPKDVRGMVPNRKRYLTAEDTLLARKVIDSTFKLRESIDYNKLRAEKEAKKKKDEKKKLAQPALKPNEKS